MSCLGQQDAAALAAEGRGLVDEALQVLTKNYDAALKSRYPRVIAEFDAILAQAYLQKGDMARARDYALKTLDHGIKEAHTEPQAMAYHTLYQVARASGDERAALSYHEKFAAADKGYLDELSARQLAYERMKHEAEQDRMEADAASQQNELRQLQTQLNDKNRETTLLYVALAITVLVTIAFWLWRSRRSR